MQALPAFPALTEVERRRQEALSDIADWYREGAPIFEVERSGSDVVTTIDHLDRIIRVERYDRYAAQRAPIEERMEFDADVLALVQGGLRDPDHAVILDCSDVPGKVSFGPQSKRGLSARVLVVSIRTGDVVDERTIVKERPQFPPGLQRDLLAVPRVEGPSYVIRRAQVAERFVAAFVRAA